MTGAGLPRYVARPASDRLQDWPVWLVADQARGGRNVTGDLLRRLFPQVDRQGATLMVRRQAERLAAIANLVLP